MFEKCFFFLDELPTEKQLEVVQKLIDCAVDGGYVAGNYSLRGHRDVYSDTTCPGDALYNEIQSWPQYQNGSQKQ